LLVLRTFQLKELVSCRPIATPELSLLKVMIHVSEYVVSVYLLSQASHSCCRIICQVPLLLHIWSIVFEQDNRHRIDQPTLKVKINFWFFNTTNLSESNKNKPMT